MSFQTMFIRFEGFAKDKGSWDNPELLEARNVLPVYGNWVPMPNIDAVSLTVADGAGQSVGVSRMIEYPHSTDGNILYVASPAQFAGTDRLLKLNGTAWTDVSKSGGYSSTLPEYGWQMEVYGQRVVATNGIDEIQSFAEGDTNFSDMITSSAGADVVREPGPFKARLVRSMYGQLAHLMAAYTTESSTDYPIRLRWSRRDNVADFNLGGGQGAGYQDLGDSHGPITGLARGLEHHYIFKRSGIIAMTWPAAFREISSGLGTRFPKSVIEDNRSVYFMSDSGPAVTTDGGTPVELARRRAFRTLREQSFSEYAFNSATGAGDCFGVLNHSTGLKQWVLPGQDWTNDRGGNVIVSYSNLEDRFSITEAEVWKTVEGEATIFDAATRWDDLGEAGCLCRDTYVAFGVNSTPFQNCFVYTASNTSRLAPSIKTGYLRIDPDTSRSGSVISVRPFWELLEGGTAPDVQITLTAKSSPGSAAISIGTSSTSDEDGWYHFGSQTVSAPFWQFGFDVLDTGSDPININSINGVEVKYSLTGEFSR